jgi:hypothetical protein
MADSKVMMPRIGKVEGDAPAITSQTRVKQGCPISPILFIIIYDLLVVTLSRSPSVAEIEAYANDLAVLLATADKITETNKIFDDYCKATGAKMNHKKCFIMSQDKDFKPSGCWEPMEESNYKSNSTLYLGVPISREINPSKDWKKVLTRMADAASKIKRLQLRGAAKIQAINTNVIPTMGYMGRYKLINKEVAGKMWKIIRSALGSQAPTGPHLLAGESLPFEQGPKLRHPILLNWALLNSRTPSHANLLNPNTIGEARREANQAIQGLCGVAQQQGAKSKVTYKLMTRKLGPRIEDLVSEFGCKAEAITYNLSHKIPRSPKRCLTLLVTKRWATNDKLGNIRGLVQTCRACKSGKENLNHIFNECIVIRKALCSMAKSGSRCGVKMWENTKGLLGLSVHPSWIRRKWKSGHKQSKSSGTDWPATNAPIWRRKKQPTHL